jgi:hypothetical protein
MWTLTLCIGMWLGTCGARHTFDFPDRDSCERERAQQLKTVGAGYALCAPKTPAPPAILPTRKETP